MAASDFRSHTRIRKNMLVDLRPTDASHLKETARAQNVSAGGARVTTKNLWHPGEFVLMSFHGTGVSARARVVYCQRLENRNFAVGLELLNAGEGLSKIH
jgi:PilZ domain